MHYKRHTFRCKRVAGLVFVIIETIGIHYAALILWIFCLVVYGVASLCSIVQHHGFQKVIMMLIRGDMVVAGNNRKGK